MFINTDPYMLEIISDVKHARSTQLASNRLIKFANNMLSVDGRHVNQKVMEMPHMRRNLIFAVIAYDQVEVKTEQAVVTGVEESSDGEVDSDLSMVASDEQTEIQPNLEDVNTSPVAEDSSNDATGKRKTKIGILVDTRERYEFDHGSPFSENLHTHVLRYLTRHDDAVIYPCTLLQRNTGIYDRRLMKILLSGEYTYSVFHRFDNTCSMSVKFRSVVNSAATGCFDAFQWQTLPCLWPTTRQDVQSYKNYVWCLMAHHMPEFRTTQVNMVNQAPQQQEDEVNSAINKISIDLLRLPEHPMMMSAAQREELENLKAVLGLAKQVKRAVYWQNQS